MNNGLDNTMQILAAQFSGDVSGRISTHYQLPGTAVVRVDHTAHEGPFV